MRTLPDLLNESASAWPGLPAVGLHDDTEPWSWTYAELQDSARRASAYLAAQGIARGDRLVFWGGNRPEWVAAFFGAQTLGAIVIPLDVRSREELLVRIELLTQPKHMLLGKEQAASLTGSHPPHTLFDELQPKLRAVEPASASASPPGADDTAELVFTSGTTGNPKGVVLTHKNIVSYTQMTRTRVPPTPRHRVLSLLPLSHMFEQTTGLFTPLSGGASITYITSLRPDVIFGAMQMHRITNMSVVPQIMQLFRDGIEREIRKQGKQAAFERLHRVAGRLPIGVRRVLFRSLHQRMGGAFDFFASGGAYLDPDLALWWEALGVKVVQGYGMTEAAPIVACHWLSKRNPRSVGKPAPGVDMRIAEDGEILVRGDNLSPGYWQNPGATADAFVDGWYHTGDLGTFDASGWLYLRGRKTNIVVLGNGMNVYPEDVEHALLADTRVKDAVVLGITRDKEIEVHAVLLLAKGTDAPAATDIVRGANKRLAAHQQIRRHTLWPADSFPLTPTLKVRRGEVAESVAQMHSQAEAGRPVTS
jgi:long-chain acyl-CoA synthetase